MANLDGIRKEINNIDENLKELFLKRMALSKEVAQTKIVDKSPIFRGDREVEILNRISANLPDELKQGAKSLFSSIMLLSRENQYKYYVENGILPACAAPFLTDDYKEEQNICYFGKMFSWSHLAAEKMLPHGTFFGSDTFDEVFAAVSEGRADCGVLPLDNSTAGTVREVYDLLKKNNLYINDSTILDIKYCLAANKNADFSTIKEVYSHTQALSQCKDYLDNLSFAPKVYENTAAAANFVAKSNNNKYAALCNKQAALIYGLKILEEDIRDSGANTTRFIKISKNPSSKRAADTISIYFTLSHESGTLSSVFNIFKDIGINVIKIESRPIPKERFRYSFYLDFKGSIRDNKVLALLLQLESELEELNILGHYKFDE